MDGDEITLQPYTLREYTAGNMLAPRRKVADIGYRNIEFAGYGDVAVANLREVLDRSGLRAPPPIARYGRRLQADIYGMPVRRTAVEEGPAHGAAFLSGVAAGAYNNVDEVFSWVSVSDELIEPNQANHKLYAGYFELYGSLYSQTRDTAHRLGELTRANATDPVGRKGKE